MDAPSWKSFEPLSRNRTTFWGCVANFAQEVVKGQLPLSEGRLRGQGVEQCGRSAALISGLYPHLSFLDPVHELNPH
jgi:hypothetical protein